MPYATVINGEIRNVRQPTEEAAWAWLESWTHSGPDAVKEVREVPADRWSPEEAAHLRRIAPMMFRHDHPQQIYPASERALVRENCQACCLEGYDSDREAFKPLSSAGPNVSNWQRDYVQAGREIPAKWRAAFWSFKTDENTAWAACVALDIATFGVRFSDGERIEPLR